MAHLAIKMHAMQVHCSIIASAVMLVGYTSFLWLAAGNVTCKVQLRNTGNVRLTDLYVSGDENDCAFAGPVWRGDTVNCSMTR